jgi:ribonuclease BN (tRNA processing enzyme)
MIRAAAALAALAIAACSEGPPPKPHGSAQPVTAPRARVSKTRVVLLGTGTPVPDPDHSGPSLAVVAGGQAYLVDFGPGVVRRAQAAFLAGVAELEATKLTRAFLTHLHGDHTAGYPDLVFTPFTVGRRAPLEVFGPPGTERMTGHVLEAYREDLALREKASGVPVRDADVVVARDVPPGVVYRDRNVTVKAFAVSHGACKDAYGYRFETADRTVVVSGDTGPCDAVAAACAGCDVLVHEVYSAARLALGPPDWRSYHESSHTSTTQLARTASAARPKLLVLTHALLWGATEEELLAEIRAGYAGKVVFGNDLDVW